jgi:hypothetical protein
LNFRNLSTKVARGEALTEQFYTMYLCFYTATAVVSGDFPVFRGDGQGDLGSSA